MKSLLTISSLIFTVSLLTNVRQVGAESSSGSGDNPPLTKQLFIPYGSYLEGSRYTRDRSLNREHA